jgi:hypothetical protein
MKWWLSHSYKGEEIIRNPHLHQRKDEKFCQMNCAVFHENKIVIFNIYPTKTYKEPKNLLLILFHILYRLSIAPHLRTTVYSTVIKHGGTTEWEFLWSKYQEETDATHKGKIMLGLTSTRQPWLLQR